MLTLHPRAVAGVAAEAAAPEDGHDEGRACYCVVAACVSLLLFVVLAAATANVAKACAVSGAAVLLLGLAGCLAPSWDGVPAAARQQAPTAPVRLVVHHRCAACGLPDAAIGALPTFAYEPPPPRAQQLRAALRGVPGGRAGRRGGAPAPGVPPPLPRRLRRRLAARAPDLPALPLRPLPAERHLEGCRPCPGRRRRHGGVLARRPAAGVRTRSSPVHRNLGGAFVIPTVHS